MCCLGPSAQQVKYRYYNGLSGLHKCNSAKLKAPCRPKEKSSVSATAREYKCGIAYTTASGGFLVVSGERVLNCYNFAIKHCLLHSSLMKENFCFGKMFLSTNVILRAVSCIVRNCFLSVGSKYGITACTISKCGIKDAVWQSFSSTTF